MRVIGLIALATAGFASMTGAQTSADALPSESVQFAHATDEMKVDGKLDETAWGSATPVTRFFEVAPGNIEAPPVSTEARFLYDSKYIYVGIRAHDSNPRAIRSSLVRRDQVLTDQDYVEVLLDPLSAKHSAFMFRTNPKGVATDGQYDEVLQTRDYAPDFNFDVKAAVDSEGWTAEFRIPLSTLRYEAGDEQSWTFVIYRSLPREKTITIASAPIPRASNCVLCFADRISGISLSGPKKPFYITPQVTYSRASMEGRTATNKARVGADAKWQVRSDTVLDMTVAPDFSQIEADDLQLTANTRFALSVLEKRPFFLESADLLSTPIIAVYTRAFTDPDAGVRITQRNNTQEYTALLLRDAGGGIVIEPGAISSGAALQDFESTGFVGRYKYHFGDTALGTLATARVNDDGSQNLVYGFDTHLSLSTSDKITAQILRSQTRNPDRPDLLSTWNGQKLDGAAAALRWEHSVDSWYSYLTYKNYSHGFRTWNGFETQVGVSSLAAVGSYYFHPRNSFLTRVAPTLTFSSVDESSGQRLSRSVSPGFSIEGARDTYLSLSWSPHAQEITPTGLKSYDSYSVSLVTTPVSWMPQVTVTLLTGDTLDTTTGEVGAGRTFQAIVPLRLFSRLELSTSLGYQSLDSRRRDVAQKRLFTQRNTQVNAIYHFSSRLYAQALYQSSTFTAARSPLPLTPDDPIPIVGLRSDNKLSSLLVSYQTNWQTRYYFGFRHSENSESASEVFAKLSYAFEK